MHENLVIVRGGGDIASGSIEKLHKCGFNVLVLEVENQVPLEERYVMVKQFIQVKWK